MVSNRLRTIVDLVSGAHVAADIGCDHGYVAKSLLEEHRAKMVIACDISEKSLLKTAKLVAGSGLNGKILIRRGDGLKILGEEEADVIVIAGMGGRRIMYIMENDKKKARYASKLVLAPNRNEKELRKYLLSNGYAIRDERLALEGGRYYQVISASAGVAEPETDEFFYIVGRKLIENGDKNLRGFLRKEITRLETVLSRAYLGKDQKEYAKRLTGLKKKMEEVWACL